MKKYFIFLLCCLSINTANARDSFNVCWSHYVGWEPWHYADTSGILDRWAGKYGIDISLQRVDGYVDSIERFTAGEFDACTMTQMDALTIPAAQGVDTSIIIIGDYSNGNDGIVSSEVKSVQDLKGKDVLLVKYSVSHYLLARALDNVGLSEKDIRIIDTPDTIIYNEFSALSQGNIVTWNPILQDVIKQPNTKVLFNSSELQGEILDVMVTQTESDIRLKKALTGAWYEVMAMLTKDDPKLLANMAESAGTSRVSILKQLSTTQMFHNPRRAAKITRSKSLTIAMEKMLGFCQQHGLIGDVESKSTVGIAFPDGKVMGDADNVKLRFDSRYMEMAANKTL